MLHTYLTYGPRSRNPDSDVVPLLQKPSPVVLHAFKPCSIFIKVRGKSAIKLGHLVSLRRCNYFVSNFNMAFRRAAGSLALRFARSSRSFNTVSQSVAAAVETPVCSVAKPQVHLSRCFSAAAEPAPAPSAVKGYVTQVNFPKYELAN